MAAQCFEDWTKKQLGAIRVAENTMAFMFESSFGLSLTKWGEEECGGEGWEDEQYYEGDWQGKEYEDQSANVYHYRGKAKEL